MRGEKTLAIQLRALFFLFHLVKKLDDILPLFGSVESYCGSRMLVEHSGDHVRKVISPHQLLAHGLYMLLDTLEQGVAK